MHIEVTVTSATGKLLGTFGAIEAAADTIRFNAGSTYAIKSIIDTPCANHPSFEADNCPSCGTSARIAR